MPKQHKGGSFTVRPGRQARLSQKVTVRTNETRFKPGNPKPVYDMMKGIDEVGKGMSESWEERADQSGL